jgi:inhibitor of growth protein 3
MPRDDLSIDFIGRKMPPQLEHHDAAAVLDEWTNRVANLPAEIAFMQEEIAEKDRLMQQHLLIIAAEDSKIQKWIRANGSHNAHPKEADIRKIIRTNYDAAEIIQEEKIALAQKTQLVIDKHTRVLDGYIKGLQDRGEFPNDPDIPSLLRPQAAPTRPRVDTSAAASMPLGQIITNGATAVYERPKQPNQYTQRNQLAAAQAQAAAAAAASSAPATPAASLLLNRHQRESSLGAASNKRQRLAGATGTGTTPAAPSNLARHSSMTPGTPRASTPSGVRAGSAGPRGSQKITKKVAPLGSRQSGMPRKGKPGKSGLSRVKRSGNKNSPSSTNDSELSDVESGSGEEDEDGSQARKDGDMDDEMGDDGDGDDRKYCTCERVSFGDMVACDNNSCPYEWFHWECVGITKEPHGRWICPTCSMEESLKTNKDKKKK